MRNSGNEVDLQVRQVLGPAGKMHEHGNRSENQQQDASRDGEIEPARPGNQRFQ